MGRRAILGLFSLALTALLIEVGARLILALIGPGNAPIEFGWKPSGGRASTFRDRVYVPDSRVFFRLSPNLDIEITSNPRIFDLHTDSRGMRSPEPAIPKPSGNYRVLAIGDSCTLDRVQDRAAPIQCNSNATCSVCGISRASRS